MTEFQRICIEKIKNTLNNEINFQKIIGKREVYFKSELKIKKKKIEIYVYDDEAGFMTHNERWNLFEKVDYKSTVELLNSFIKNLLLASKKIE